MLLLKCETFSHCPRRVDAAWRDVMELGLLLTRLQFKIKCPSEAEAVRKKKCVNVDYSTRAIKRS